MKPKDQDLESLWMQEHSELVFLNSLLRDITAYTLNSSEFTAKLMAELNKVLPVETALILAKSGQKSDISIKYAFSPNKKITTAETGKMEAEQYLARWACQIKETIILNNKLIDIRIMDPYSSELAPGTNSYLFSPVTYKGEVFGALALINKTKGVFNLRDKFLSEAACHTLALFTATGTEAQKNSSSGLEKGILHDLSSGFIYIDDEGKIPLINDRAIEILGIKEEIIGKYFYEVLPLNRRFFSHITEGLKNHKTEQRLTFTLELESKKKIGYSTFIVTGSKGSPPGLGIIFQELSIHKK